MDSWTAGCFPFLSLLAPSLMYSLILRTLFGDKGPNLSRRLVGQPSSDGLLAECHGVFLGHEVNIRICIYISRVNFIAISLIDRLDGLESGQQLTAPPHQHEAFLFSFFEVKTSLGALCKTFVGIELD